MCVYHSIGHFCRGRPRITDERLLVDVVNALGEPEYDAPIGSPGAGKGLQHRLRVDNTRVKEILKLQFRDKATTAKDIIEDIRRRGWVRQEPTFQRECM